MKKSYLHILWFSNESVLSESDKPILKIITNNNNSVKYNEF